MSRISYPVSLTMRSWRNWQTRKIQVLVGATPWRFKSSRPHQLSSDNGEEVTPVPISNTEVKLFSADGTWTAGSWESRTSLGTQQGLISSEIEPCFVSWSSRTHRGEDPISIEIGSFFIFSCWYFS